MQAGLNIAYICDEDYVLTTVISMRSLKQNREKNLQYRLYIVTKGLSDESIQSILTLQEENDFIITICKNRVNAENIFAKCRHVSATALLKFALPSILDELDYVLYVDGDILFRKGFERIFDININDVYAAVVKDMPAYEGNHLQELCLCDYFNSGVMYLNLKKMREGGIENKLLVYKKNEKKHLFMDQDAFNIVLNKNVLFMHPKYNLIYDIYRKYDEGQIARFYGIYENNVVDLRKSACMLHMAGARKPWNDLESEHLHEWLFYIKNFDEYSKWEKGLYCDKNSLQKLKDQLRKTEQELAELKEQNRLMQELQSAKFEKLEQRLDSLENWIFIRIYKFLVSHILKKK